MKYNTTGVRQSGLEANYWRLYLCHVALPRNTESALTSSSPAKTLVIPVSLE